VSRNVVGLAFRKVKGKGHPITCHEVTEREQIQLYSFITRLTPNDPYMGRTASLTSKRSIL